MDEPEDIIADQAEQAEIPGHGPQVIRAHLKTLPNRPGVYRMFDAKGDVIYVGKARSLKNRVANYTRLGGHTNRIAAMIALTAQHGIRDDRDGSRGAAARSQSDQEAASRATM